MFPSVSANPVTEVMSPTRGTTFIELALQGRRAGRLSHLGLAASPLPVRASIHPTSHTKGDAISWARFDDNYDSNPKIIAAGRDGKNLHEASIRWCCRQRTGGVIPKAALHLIAELARLPANKPLRNRAAATLVAVNLWEDDGDNWRVHDFGEYDTPKRFIPPADRITINHAARDPLPVPRPVPVVSLKDLRDRAIGRGVAAEGLDQRLDGLRQLVEAKGAKHWIAYVLKGFGGGSCLFDQWVSRWREEDHQASKQAEDQAPVIPLPSKRMA